VHHLFFLSCIDTLEILVQYHKREEEQLMVEKRMQVATSNSIFA
jgi:hypothetical protein